LSLRARLLLGMVALVTVGLGVAAIVTYEEQRSFLLTRADQQVASALLPIAARLGVREPGRRAPLDRSPKVPRGRGPFGPGPVAYLPPGTFGELLGPAGKLLRKPVTFSYQPTASPPSLPGKYPISRTGSDPRLFTVSSKDGSGLRYRVAAFSTSTGRLVVAVPLREVDQTLHRLVVVEALVGGGVILGLVLLGWLVIRVGLLPLERIGRVASEIAGGDLSRRVTSTNPHTEVGRLGLSLNEMLAQIEQAFSDRRESEDRLRHFLTDASHELRTPLASIRGYAELFRLGAASEPAELERAMARIEAESARMGVLVEDLLMLARLDQLPEARRVPVDLRELVEHAADDTRAMAPGRKVSLTAEEATQVLGDPDQLRQVLANLMRNAVIHTPANSAIEIHLHRDRDSAVLEVRDHGPGLPTGVGDQVFERFWRSEAGRSRGRGGAGLGLAIVQGIVHAHGGQVSAEAAAGGGAVFRVILPGGSNRSPSLNAHVADELVGADQPVGAETPGRL
jgi:two-component system OmpR family sensor kinase